MTRAAIRTFQRSIGARETGEPTKDVFAALQQAMERRNAAASAQPAPATIDLGAPEPPPAPPTSADIARTAPEAATRIEAKIEPAAEPAKVEPPSTAPVKIDPPKPPMPSVEAATPAAPPVVATSEQPRPAPPATAIDLGQPEPPPAPPTSADIARADADAWPASTVDQVTAIQRLLRDLNFSRDPPDGIYGPATRAAIVDFERTAGLAQTGEPSKALFESLKDMRSTMLRKSLALTVRSSTTRHAATRRRRRCSRPPRGVGRIVEGKAGGAAAAHGGVARAVAVAQEGQHIGDRPGAARSQRRLRSLPRSASAAAKLRQIAPRPRAPARGVGERAATRCEDLARRQRDAGIDQQDRSTAAAAAPAAGARRRRNQRGAAGQAHRHVGAQRAARSNSSSTGRATRQRSISARSVAAASAEPPPRPAATGMCLASRSAARGATPARSASRRAAFSTRLSASSASAGGERPVDARATGGRTAGLDLVGEVDEGDQRIEQVIAVGAAADDVQPEIDLGGRRAAAQERAQPPCFLSAAFS